MDLYLTNNGLCGIIYWIMDHDVMVQWLPMIMFGGITMTEWVACVMTIVQAVLIVWVMVIVGR